ncbi:hypothetical protein Taro_012575 [Colocasia esculenta]|uniref:Uncharacterized protein n=1 Tax=Colocasia esculenta TaxID=4460 RepID=A0A843UJG1_COLES|nr:hypothetical protein [Colocasia esculenta]
MVVDVDDHVKVHESITPSPHSELVVILSINKDERVNEEIKKGKVVISKSTNFLVAVEAPSSASTHAAVTHPLPTTTSSSTRARKRPLLRSTKQPPPHHPIFNGFVHMIAGFLAF